MSGDIEAIVIQEEKSSDKKEIEVEERERMLNEENKAVEEAPKTESENAETVKPAAVVEPMTEEGREVKPKFIPIGGIKMPGFFTRSKSKEKCKDGDDGAQGELLEKTTEETKENTDDKDTAQKKNKLSFKMPNMPAMPNIPNPFAKLRQQPAQQANNAEESEKPSDESTKPNNATGQRKGLINAIRLPLANMIPRKFRKGDGQGDAEAGLDSAKQAELASMETLDDNKETAADKAAEVKNEDGMESVKLDVEDKTDGEEPLQKDKLHWRERIRQQKFYTEDLVIVSGVLLFIILIIIIVAIAASGGGHLTKSPIKDGRYVDAITSCGIVEGILEDNAIAFRGIPYAVPPVGDNRWNFARPLNKMDYCWNGTMKAHNATPPCVQIYGNGTIDGAEDCLMLDVITPEVRYDNPLPVIVLIGSNSLIGGSPGNLRPSTRYARSKDVVFVRPNFRVGALGFMSTKALSQSLYPRRSGNFALSDIIAALEWIQLNIKHFAGDPKAVTVFGHRAGATLVTALLGYPKSKSLFARAWLSSGSTVFPGKDIDEGEDANASYMDLIRCQDAACLKKSNVDDIINSVPDTWRSASPDLPTRSEAPDQMHEWFVNDGVIVTKPPADAIVESSIPIVIGTTSHESSSRKLYLKNTAWTAELVTKHVNDSKLGELGITDDTIKRYNATYQGLAAMISDIRTVCPLLNFARRRSDVPFYFVTQEGGDLNIADVDADVSAILGRYEPKTPEQRRYVAAMQQLFYHYVWHGEVPQSNSKNNFSILEVGQDVLPVRSHPNCDYWFSNDVVPRYARRD